MISEIITTHIFMIVLIILTIEHLIIMSVGRNRAITCTRCDREGREKSNSMIYPLDSPSLIFWMRRNRWESWARDRKQVGESGQICLWSSSPSLFTDGVTTLRGCYSCPNLAQLLLIQCLVRCRGINVLRFYQHRPLPQITRHKMVRFTAISPNLLAVKTNTRRRLFIAVSIMEECIGMKWSGVAGSGSGGKSWNILSTWTTPKGVVTTQWWKFKNSKSRMQNDKLSPVSQTWISLYLGFTKKGNPIVPNLSVFNQTRIL